MAGDTAFSQAEYDRIAISRERDGLIARLVNASAEQSLLGALLAKVELVEQLPATWRPEHLAVDGHAQIAEAVVACRETQARGPVIIPVAQALGKDSELANYVPGLVAAAVSFLPDTVASYAALTTDLWQRRQAIDVAGVFQDQLSEPQGAPAAAMILRLMGALEPMLGGEQSARAVSLDDAIDAALDAADAAARGDGPAGISTGFPSLDDALGGLEPGTMTVLAGRPGMGKSALGWQIAVNVARSGIGVLAVSLEMSAAELGRRALATVSGVPMWRMKRGKHGFDADRLIVARKELRGIPLTIEDAPGLSGALIAMKARTAHRKFPLGLVMIDHLHIVAPAEADVRHGPTWGVGRVSGAMKRLAKELRCPVLLLAQLSRAVEARDDKRPTLADLRQSGDIEQDADAVAFVYRPEYYLPREAPGRNPGEKEAGYEARLRQFHDDRERLAGKAEVIFAKVRDGAPGVVHLHFRGDTATFSEAQHGEE